MYLVDIKYQLGSKVSNNTDVENKYQLKPGFIFEKTGIKERRNFAESENPIEIGSQLIKEILSKNNLIYSNVDAIYGSSNPYSKFRIPSETHQTVITAGFKDVGIHHVNYGCGGYLAGLQDILNYLKNSRKDSYILFVLSDYPSKMVKDYTTESLFSDAVCVSLWSNSENYSNNYKVDEVFFSNLLENPKSLTVESGYWGMEGGDVSRFVFKIPELLKNKFNINVYDYEIIPHQANPSLLSSLEQRHNLKVYKDDAVSFGNTTTCALFIAIANNLDRNKKKSSYLCLGFGDTESYGAFILNK